MTGRLELLATQTPIALNIDGLGAVESNYTQPLYGWGTACAADVFTNDDATPFCMAMHASAAGLALPPAW